MKLRVMRCVKCRVKTEIEISDTEAETLSDAIACGARGDGWDLYWQLHSEIQPHCFKCAELVAS